MKISTKGRYALRMLLDLAEHQGEGFIALKEVAKRQDISKQYLEHIVSLLNTSNILRAGRGKQGGYMLARAPEEYTVGQILRVTEGCLAPVTCLEQDINNCHRADLCKTLPIWRGLYKVILEYLDNITLRDVLDQYAKKSSDNYVI